MRFLSFNRDCFFFNTRHATHHADVQYSRREVLEEVSLDRVVPVGRFVTARADHNIVRGHAALQVVSAAAAAAVAYAVLGILDRVPVRRVTQNVASAVSSESADIRNVRNATRILHLRKLHAIFEATKRFATTTT